MTVAYIYRRIDKADGGSLFCFVNEDNDYTVNITGTNNIGSPIAFEDMIEETMYTPTCLYNFISSKGNISVKGNGSLTIYDYESGIKSFKSIDFTKDFTGKITIYDSGKTIEVELNCCLIAKEDIIIRNGTFRLYNDSSSCISAKNIYLLTDDIICSSNTKAINAKDQLVIKQNGAFNAFESINDKGSKLTTTLDNQTLSGYSLVNDYESAKYISLKRQTVGTSVDTCLGKFIALITVTLSMVYVARKKH